MEIIKQDKSKSEREFESLLNQDLKNRTIKEGTVTTGTVSKVGEKFVLIDLNLKSEGAIPVEEFKLTKELDKLKPGTQIEILLEKIENKNGDIVISREKARKAMSWSKLEKAFQKNEDVKGIVLSRCKGGYVCEIESCLCFLPGSQIALQPSKNFDHLLKTEQTFAIVKMDKRRGNVVLSRRQVLEKIRNKDRDKIVSKMKEGDEITGIVKNLTDWGAFIDLQGVDALLHITDLSWDRISRPSELLSVGQSIKTKIIKIEKGTNKISLGVKQLIEDPYATKIDKYVVGSNYPAVVTKIQQYGAFAKLDDGLEGLIHSSQLSWLKKSVAPEKILSTSQKIQVQILEKDSSKRRISLSYKNTLINPWHKLIKDHKVGDESEGIVRNITDFGLFVLIKDSELSGMIHYKDLSWSEKESELDKWKKNMTIKFKFLEINQDNEKIRLGVKQLANDPFEFYINKSLSDIVTVIVDSSSKEGIYVHAGNKNMLILIKRNQLAKEIENQRQSRFSRGDKVDAMIVKLNKTQKSVTLSIKALEEKNYADQIKKFGSTDSGGVLSDVFNFEPLLKKKSKK
jgi:small subunit ribosomal protein S1|tara:strand:+ start:3470 stop:5179 length:1710 start_codon:yes stop_codon:yes gene_type:complete